MQAKKPSPTRAAVEVEKPKAKAAAPAKKSASPVKEVKTVKATPLVAAAPAAKKDKKAAAKVVAKPAVEKATKKQSKPAKDAAVAAKKKTDADDGWWTVPTKSDKKKVRDLTASPVAVAAEKSPEKPSAKLLKDQANKVKKEAGSAVRPGSPKKAASPAPVSPAVAAPIAAPVMRAPTIPIVPTPITAETTGFEFFVGALKSDKKTDDLIKKIEEAIIDEVVAPAAPKAGRIMENNKKSSKASLDFELSAEKIDAVKAVESNVAFDELGGKCVRVHVFLRFVVRSSFY